MVGFRKHGSSHTGSIKKQDILFAKQLFVSEKKIAASCTVAYLETFKFSIRQFTTVDENVCMYLFIYLFCLFVCLMTSVVSKLVKEKIEVGTKKRRQSVL